MENARPEQANRMNQGVVRVTTRARMRGALVLAITADLVQMVMSPLVVEGAASPIDDVLDVVVGGVLSWLLGWHWEFLPSFLAKLVPGVDLFPLWTLAVANVYRKSNRGPITIEGKMGE